MAKSELKIEILKGDTPFSKIYVLSQSIKGFSTYEKAKAINRFIERETKVLEIAIDNDLRNFLRKQGISIANGSIEALNDAFLELERQGKTIEIRDRYFEIGNERIVGESVNKMTCIIEDDILSCAIEVIIYG